jgi:uncharacterized membrane protein (DUF2068 family)
MSTSDGAGAGAATRAESDDPALRLIIAYKLTRGAASILASALIATLTATGHTHPLDAVVEHIRHHATSAWSIGLANMLVSAVAPGHLWLVAAALALDGATCSLEGWSLHRRWWWGPWLVVGETTAFLPLEAIAIADHASAGRIILLGLNVAVAAYLAWRAAREHESRAASH